MTTQYSHSLLLATCYLPLTNTYCCLLLQLRTALKDLQGLTYPHLILIPNPYP
jgi:hypothetical protein